MAVEKLAGADLAETISREDVDELIQSLSDINRRSFRRNLVDMLDDYGVFIEDVEGDLRRAVDLRNEVVHRGLLPYGEGPEGGEAERSTNVIEELLVRIFLTLLDYRGHYISPLCDLDYRNFPRRGD
jgi:hypothetical protein